jgi:hypothetical protein
MFTPLVQVTTPRMVQVEGTDCNGSVSRTDTMDQSSVALSALD